MGKFELIEGTHSHGTREFKKGDILESNKMDLCAMFPNKFKIMPEAMPGAINVDKLLHHAPVKGAPKAPTMEQVANDEPIRHVSDEELAVETPDNDGNAGDAKQSNDVSSQYTGAVEGGLLVLKVGAKYNVEEKEAPGVNLNQKPLKAKEVQDFVTEYLG